jgi:hypothetical protein
MNSIFDKLAEYRELWTHAQAIHKLERQQPASLVDVDESVDFLLGALVALIDEGCENALIA